MTANELIPHLFRTEFSKICAVLSKYFGIGRIQAAEDIASETFLSALETWTYKGIPENPTAWLYTVAKNKAGNYVKRSQIFTDKVTPAVKGAFTAGEFPEVDLSETNISDSRLQMLFAICHPSIPVEAQVGLALRILCGFGIDEIASAFLTSKDTVNKRLFRAKEKLRAERVNIEFPPRELLGERIGAVLSTLYLLFSEGYYSESHDSVLREDLCFEAMRLTCLLAENKNTNQPAVNALLSLMCFHASRFPARKDDNGEIILYQDQDESLWDERMIAEGAYYLHRASVGTSLSKYHLEAAIAWWHTHKADTSGKWENILHLYNQLLVMEYSPIAALNRTYALSKIHGNMRAIAEAEKLQLTGNHYYFTLLGELYRNVDDGKSKAHFHTALGLAKTRGDRQSLMKRLEEID